MLTTGLHRVELGDIEDARYGYPLISDREDQDVVVFRWTEEPEFGMPSLTDNGPRHVSPSGIDTMESAAQLIWNLHRELPIEGFDATEFGTNDPMIHFDRGFDPVGVDMDVYGDAWLSFSPREVETEGFVTFISRWTNYMKATRVWNYRYFVEMYAFNDFAEFGDNAVDVYTGPQDIRPYGVAPLCIACCLEVENAIV